MRAVVAQLGLDLLPVICLQCGKPLDLSAPHDPGGRRGNFDLITKPCHLGCELPTFYWVPVAERAAVIAPPTVARKKAA